MFQHQLFTNHNGGRTRTTPARGPEGELISTQASQGEVAKPHLSQKQECLSHEEISCKSLENLAGGLKQATKHLGRCCPSRNKHKKKHILIMLRCFQKRKLAKPSGSELCSNGGQPWNETLSSPERGAQAEPTIGSGVWWVTERLPHLSVLLVPVQPCSYKKKQIRRDGRFPDQIKQSFPGEIMKKSSLKMEMVCLSCFQVRDSISALFLLTVGDFSPPSSGPFFNS